MLGPNGAGKTSTVETLEGYRRPAAGRVRVLGLSPQDDHAALSGRVGVMLQRGGVYPMLGPRRVLAPLRRLLPGARPGRRAARPGRPAQRRRHALAPPLGRRAATALAGLGPGRAARGGLPRRADGRRRPRGPPRRARRGGRAEGEGRLRRPHHPRAGRGREDGGPHCDPLGRPRRAGGHAARPHRRAPGPAADADAAGSSPSAHPPPSTSSPWRAPSARGPRPPRQRRAATGWRPRR